MVMRPDPRTGALTTVRRRHWGPWWLWTIVVILAASAAYAGYWVRSANEQLARAEAARQSLAENSESLQADHVALQRQLDQAKEDEAKSRAEARASSAVVEKLQESVTALKADLAAARTAADASKQEAERLAGQITDAEAAFAQVGKLRDRVTALKADLDAAREKADASKQEAERLASEAAAAAAAKAELEREIASLKESLGEMQQKRDAVTTGTTPAGP
jgi:chromosome segregation ATPase